MKPFSSILITLVILLSVPFASCVKKTETPVAAPPVAAVPLKTPEEVVRHFIDVSATAKTDGDRQKLQELCSGEMRRAFETMTPEAFRIAYLSNNVKVNEIKIIENTTKNETAVIRYQVSLDNAQGTDVTKETNEREVELAETQGNWYINSIRPKGSDKIAFTRGMIF